MSAWVEGVEALANPATSISLRSRHRFPWNRRTPILITGSSGAGKTEIWRKLTDRPAPDRRSERPDEGNFFLPGRRRRPLALTTIPGQISQERFRDMKWFFGEATVLEGVIFVASFGFDAIWPDEAADVVSSLSSVDIETLSLRNIAAELDSFRETCTKLSEKRMLTAGTLGPRWLLVLVNKADLFWDGIDHARDYYAPGCDSDFDRVSQALIGQMGGLAPFRYDALPVTLNPRDYNFVSSTMRLPSATQLQPPHAEASLRTLVSVLEELCGL